MKQRVCAQLNVDISTTPQQVRIISDRLLIACVSCPVRHHCYDVTLVPDLSNKLGEYNVNMLLLIEMTYKTTKIRPKYGPKLIGQEVPYLYVKN